MIVVPAIDLLGGQAVRLHRGRYAEATVYSDDPPSLARAWRGKAERLHVVDLEGAKAGRAVQIDTIRAIVNAFGPGVQVGGGIRTAESAASYFELGAERVVLGTAAIRDPDLVRDLAESHPDRVIVAVDASDGVVATDGWTESSGRTAIDVAKELARLPLAAFLYTDVARDGTQAGPNITRTLELARATAIEVIASGGVGALEHLRALAETREVSAAIVGRALYEKTFTLEEAVDAAR